MTQETYIYTKDCNVHIVPVRWHAITDLQSQVQRYIELTVTDTGVAS